MPNMSTILRPETGPMVIDLRGHQGNYESAPCNPPGCRTFGLWSMTKPEVGDLVIKPNTRDGTKALYKIKSVQLDFEAREGDNYYKGEMVDAIDSERRLGDRVLTETDLQALYAADSECRPR